MFDLDKAQRLINERRKEITESDNLLTLIMGMEDHLVSLASWDIDSFVYERDYSNALADKLYYADLQLRELYLRLRELFSLYATLEEQGISLTTKLKDTGYETVTFSSLTGSVMLTEDSPYNAAAMDVSSLLRDDSRKDLPPMGVLIRLFMILQEETFFFPTIDFLEKLKKVILEVYK